MYIQNPYRYVSAGGTEFKFKVSVSNGENIPLPLESGGTYNFTVNYGDGGGDKTVTTYNDVDADNTYTNAGTYEISINGTCTLFEVDNDANIDTNITEVTQWGDVGFVTLNFNGCSNLTEISSTDLPDFSAMTSFSNIFKDCTNLATVNRIDEWDISTITNMNSAFNNCDAFNLSVDSWDVSAVTAFVNMFANTAIFNQDLSSWTLKNNGAINCASMFKDALSFNGDVNSWGTGKITSAQNMFKNADSFNQPIGGFAVTTTVSTSLINLNTHGYSTGYRVHFKGITNTTGFVDVTNYYVSETSNTTNSFRITTDSGGASSGDITFGGTDDSSGVQLNMWDVSAVTNFIDMFNVNSGFNQNIGGWDVSAGTNFSGMFETSNFNNGGSSMNDWTIRTGTGVSMVAMFRDCPFNQNITSWDTSWVTNFSSMFLQNSAFNQDLSSWDVARCTAFISMFNRATSFNNGGVTLSWTTTAATTFQSMFDRASAFNQALPFDLVGVTSVKNMFSAATIFNQDLSAWDIQSLTDTMTTFGSGANFSTANWDLMISAWEGLASTPNAITIDMNATYTQTSVDSGTTDGTTANKLVDAGQNFISTVTVNDIAHNTTDDTYAKITAIDDNENLSLDNDIFISGETYVIQSSQVAKDRYSLLDTHSWTINDGGAV